MTLRELAEAFYKIVCLFLPVYFFPFIFKSDEAKYIRQRKA